MDHYTEKIIKSFIILIHVQNNKDREKCPSKIVKNEKKTPSI